MRFQPFLDDTPAIRIGNIRTLRGERFKPGVQVVRDGAGPRGHRSTERPRCYGSGEVQHMTARPAFKITARQVRDLIDITPPGHVAEVRIAFVPTEPVPSPKENGVKACDDVFGTEASD